MARHRGSALVNAGDGRHLRFHFTEADADPAHLYELTRAALDPQRPVVGAADKVARLEPAAPKLALCCFGVIAVSGANPPAPHLGLAFLPRLPFAAFVRNTTD